VADVRLLNVTNPDALTMRVTHCPINTAGIPWQNASALRRRGIDTRLVVFERYPMHPEADWSLDLPQGLLRRLPLQLRALGKLLPSTDIFHFYSGLTLVPKSLQFPILRAFRKKSVFHFLGSDIRGKPPEQLAYGKRAGQQIVGSYDAIRWVPEAHVVPPGIDLRAVDPVAPTARDRPVVVHAPSNRKRKGTAQILAALEGLNVEVDVVEGLDLVIDQLDIGWYGVFAIEAMSLAKPVLTFLHPEAVTRTEEAFGIEVPVVSVTAETLRDRVQRLVDSPDERRRIGAASRSYVEHVHDIERITAQLVAIYRDL
jgi:glycosyltransferase involved in cell wall biosynthesis